MSRLQGGNAGARSGQPRGATHGAGSARRPASCTAPAGATAAGDKSGSILRDALARVQRGQAAGIDCYNDQSKFENRIKFHLARLAEGDLPCVTLIALQASAPGTTFPHMILETGPHDEFIQFWQDPQADARRERCFPGQGWDPLMSKGEWLNISAPGCTLASLDGFNKLLREIETGLFSVQRVLAVDGQPVRDPSAPPAPARSETPAAGGRSKAPKDRWQVTIFGTAAKRPDLACRFCGDDQVSLAPHGSHMRCADCGAIYCRRNCQTTINGGCPGCRSERGDFLGA